MIVIVLFTHNRFFLFELIEIITPFGGVSKKMIQVFKVTVNYEPADSLFVVMVIEN